ncbi:Phage infection protein [Lactiplantibacillus plantarum subsp. plantarum]|uniref:Phage infection protein n=1 Tax=Lactiplantibacillus plantarum subsp. plantarum TaxID=337330 RepID=A0A2S3U9H0_LACPN|nr:Phage infection protein [Lactiplantibacillus plantarum subsp. plantarum]
MIKAEWAYMQRHKFMMIVMAIIMLIPSIYAVTFLRSMWDPYGRLNHLPVAVVNQDQAVTYQGHRLSIGHDLTHTLKQSDALEFHAMTADQAKPGKNGRYYMVLTIPKNFSQHATTLLNRHPQAMVLHYDTSAGHNFVASQNGNFRGRLNSTSSHNDYDQLCQDDVCSYQATRWRSQNRYDD